MPTIFSHPATALALRPWFRAMPRRVAIAGAIGTMLPDLDVAAFALGIPYGHPLGHRGFSHSLLFAALVAGAMTLVFRRAKLPSITSRATFAYLFVAIASHGVLDAFTNGGRGVGFLIPFSNERFFFPVTPIRVSPIGVSGFLERGLPVLVSEVQWIWLPAIFMMALGLVLHRRAMREERSRS